MHSSSFTAGKTTHQESACHKRLHSSYSLTAPQEPHVLPPEILVPHLGQDEWPMMIIKWGGLGMEMLCFGLMSCYESCFGDLVMRYVERRKKSQDSRFISSPPYAVTKPSCQFQASILRRWLAAVTRRSPNRGDWIATHDHVRERL